MERAGATEPCGAVAKRVRPQALKAFTAAVAAAATATVDRRRDHRAAAAAHFEEALPLAYLFTRGAELMSEAVADAD
jgi:hypothetical protein